MRLVCAILLGQVVDGGRCYSMDDLCMVGVVQSGEVQEALKLLNNGDALGSHLEPKDYWHRLRKSAQNRLTSLVPLRGGVHLVARYLGTRLSWNGEPNTGLKGRAMDVRRNWKGSRGSVSGTCCGPRTYL